MIYRYIFTTWQDARYFSKKYSKIWFITDPIQDENGWHIIRYI